MKVELQLEDGSTLECEVIYIFEWGGDDYAALTPVDESIEEIYFFGIEIEDKGESRRSRFSRSMMRKRWKPWRMPLMKCWMRKNLVKMRKNQKTMASGTSLSTKSWTSSMNI